MVSKDIFYQMGQKYIFATSFNIHTMHTKFISPLSAIGMLALVVLMASSCVNLSSFQTAKPVGKDSGEISIAAGGLIFSEPIGSESLGIPYLEIGGRYGVGEKVDIGLKLSSVSFFTFDAKFQIVGDETSKFAMAPGPGFGYIGSAGGTSIFNATIPLHMSYHPSQTFAFYFTPRYSTIFAAGGGGGSLNYLGGNIGFITGKKIEFGFDLAYGNLLDDVVEDSDTFEDFGLHLWQIGFGIKFPIGK